MKKFCYKILAVVFCASFMVLPAFAAESEILHNNVRTDVSDLLDGNFEGKSTVFIKEGKKYEVLQYSTPVSYEFDGITRTLLATVIVSEKAQDGNSDGMQTYSLDDWHYTKLYDIYDNGITDTYVCMSNPQFIASVAKGQTITVSKYLSVAIKIDSYVSMSLEGAVEAIKTSLKGSFSISNSNTYGQNISITLQGPGESSSDNSRAFYYKTGYHEHSITVYEYLYSSWTGIYGTNTYNVAGYEPTYQVYSQDSEV